MSRLEEKKKNPPAKAQQRNVRSFQPAPPGPVSARARAIGARRMAKDPKTRRAAPSRLSICEPLRRKIKVDPPRLHIATLQQFRQLDNVHSNPSRLIFAEQLSCGAAARLILEIDTGERLFVVVTHDKAGGRR
jgi:hypothetical protein